jgi:catechol 2,3-dioxygenase-like lactoylglutathione lyase family enzyme
MKLLISACVAAIGVASAMATHLGVPPQTAAAPTPMNSRRASAGVRSVLAIGNTVADLDRSVDFYTGVLSFMKLDEQEAAGAEWEQLTGVFGVRARIATLRLGDEVIHLTQYLAPEGRPVPVDSRSNDRWFQHIAIVVSDMDMAYRRLREHKVRFASSGPQTLPSWNADAGGIRAFYFKDPDGHVLEIIWFPEGKGDTRWRTPTERLFVGIDHTAIVVRDTEASLGFYRDALGMRVAGHAENYGTEQEHLNNVFGARVRITALRAAGGGPGVELLEYLAPTDGRVDAYAGGAVRDCDLVSWHVAMSVDDPDAAMAGVRAAHAALVSPGMVGMGDGCHACRVKDPDGHVIELNDRSAHLEASP